MQIALDFPPKVGHSLQETFVSFDEFQPAEPEFVSDLLKRLNKVKA